MLATHALDPAATLAAAVQEVYDRLRDLVDRGPSDDLLDDLSALLKRVRGKVTRARKRASVPAATGPAAPAVTVPGAQTGTVSVAAGEREGKQTAQPAVVPTKPLVAVPAAVAPPAGRVSVRLTAPAEPAAAKHAAAAPAVAAVPATQPSGKHRLEQPARSRRSRFMLWWRRPLPRRANILLGALLILGFTASIVSVNPIPSVVALALVVVVVATSPRKARRHGHRVGER